MPALFQLCSKLLWIAFVCFFSYLESQESQGAHDSTARHHRRQHWTRRNRHSLDDLDPVPAQAMDLIIPEPRLMLQSVPVSVISTSNQPHNLTHHHPVSWIPETASRTATIIPMDSQPNSIFGNSLPMESIPDLPPPAYSEIGSPGPPSYDEALKLPNMKWLCMKRMVTIHVSSNIEYVILFLC